MLLGFKRSLLLKRNNPCFYLLLYYSRIQLNQYLCWWFEGYNTDFPFALCGIHGNDKSNFYLVFPGHVTPLNQQ